jgi:DNA-binding transcriptional ArsR family regulator
MGNTGETESGEATAVEGRPDEGATSADWDGVGYVVSSKYRVTVLRRLTESPATPSRIGADAGLAVSHVSRALGECRDRGLVELLVPEERKKGRVYAASERGRAVWSLIEDADIVR